ncbi:MAG: hypothetical protein LBH14_03615, partial [Desulfobulbaceae bacterium]|nr:hypothetical protein [Desulfobulbaceae bacterium]
MPIRAINLLFIIFFPFAALAAAAEVDPAAAKAYTISSIKPEMVGNALYMTIVGDSQPIYIVTERYSPFRVLLDIANAVMPAAGSAVTLPKNDFVTYTVSTIKGQQAEVSRFEFKIAESHGYKVVTEGNDIQIAITPSVPPGETAANTVRAPPTLTDIQVEEQPGITTVKLASTAPLAGYKTSTRRRGKNKPAAMIIDIANVSIDKLAPEKIVHSATLAKIHLARRGNGARVIFEATGRVLFKFVVNKLDDGIQVIIKDREAAASTETVATPAPSADTAIDKLIESSASLPRKSRGGAKNSFLASGYSQEHISVDFYKIDIHNVFRLFHEVSNLNIVVDQDVKGTLTLALNDVPWDFALDIICNLMELNQAKRDNTIVIYPKKKEFVWPSVSG